MTRVAIIAGGPSSEAAVSRVSASAVQAALATAGHEPVVIELDRALPSRLLALAPEAAFPVTHGPVGEDGCLQGLLEVLGFRYVGCDVRASALAASKPHAKVHFSAAGLPVAPQIVLSRSDDLGAAAHRVRDALGERVVVKPASGGSAIGVTRIAPTDGPNRLVEALATALRVDDTVLVEQFFAGYEVTCGVLDVDETGPQALPPTLITSHAAEWYDFTSRYAEGGSSHQCPAPLDSSLLQRIQSIAVAGFRALGARDLGRLDFVVGRDNSVTLLELNTLPGMTATSLYPEAATVAGIPFPELCHRLVARALSRPLRQAPPVVPMPDPVQGRRSDL